MRLESIYDNKISRMVAMNAVSDAFWAYLAAGSLNLQFTHTDQANYSLEGQLTAQVTHPTLGAAFCGVGMLLAYKYGLQKEQLPVLETFTLCCVTPAVITAWNYVQPKAVELFKSLGYSTETAGYLSSIFTGLTGGSITYLLTKLIRILADSEEYSWFKENPKQYLLDFFLKLGLSLTIGAISDGVWQLVFNALMVKSAGALATTLAVVLSVALATTGSMLAMNAIINSNSYQDCLRTCAGDSEDLKTHEAPLKSCANSCFSFFGCIRSNVNVAFDDAASVARSESLITIQPSSSLSSLSLSPPVSQQGSGVQVSLDYGSLQPN